MNEAPEAVAVRGASWVGVELHPGDVVELDGRDSSDPDGDALGFAWSLGTQPAGSGAALQHAGQPRALVSLPVVGSYVVRLVVTDPDGLDDDDALELEVVASSIPFADGPFDLVVDDWQMTPPDCVPATLVKSGIVTVRRDDPSLAIAFGATQMTGTVNAADQFTVSLTQEFDWGDGCRWESFEQLAGAFSSPDAFTAAHTYTESVVSGSGCVPPCNITSTVHGTRAP